LSSTAVQPSTASHATASHAERARSAFYRPELDALRFFAFFLVFFDHSMLSVPGMKLFFEAGRLGMCLFFVLSAYLITELLLKERAETGHVNLRAFYIRRVLRIWPLYFFCLGLAFAAGRIWPFMRISVPALLAYLFIAGNWHTAIFGAIHSPWSLLWSIAVEEQFYLSWPFLARKGRKILFFGSIVAIAMGAVTVWAVCRDGYPQLGAWIWNNSFFQFAFFGLGGVLAILVRGRRPVLPRFIRLTLGVGSIFIFLLASFFLTMEHPHWSVLLGLIGYSLTGIACTMLFFSLLGHNIRKGTLLDRIVGWGRISYGLYVYHGAALWLISIPTIQLLHRYHHSVPGPAKVAVLTGIAAFPLTLAISKLSYRYLETPFLSLKKRFEIVRSRPV